jgi:ribosomal protein S12 methylthiotransferase
LLARIRERVPGVALRTALIVGLPGETEQDFQDLLRFVEEQRFERLGVFTYSREEGTEAGRMPGQVPERVKRARLEKVMELQRGISREHQRAMIGRRVEVLVEGASEETEHLLAGRNAQQAPEIDGLTYLNEGVAYPGEIVTAEITDAGDYDLVARVVGREARRAARPLPRARSAAPGRRSRLRVIS